MSCVGAENSLLDVPRRAHAVVGNLEWFLAPLCFAAHCTRRRKLEEAERAEAQRLELYRSTMDMSKIAAMKRQSEMQSLLQVRAAFFFSKLRSAITAASSLRLISFCSHFSSLTRLETSTRSNASSGC